MEFIKKLINLYYKRTFKVVDILMVPELETMRDNIYAQEGPTLNTISIKEHVLEIEWTIRLLKDKIRAITISLSKKKIPRMMVI